MRLRLTIDPETGDDSYHVELALSEEDLQLDPAKFVERFLRPASNCLLAAFDEPWPDNPEHVLARLNREPQRSVKFYRVNLARRTQ